MGKAAESTGTWENDIQVTGAGIQVKGAGL